MRSTGRIYNSCFLFQVIELLGKGWLKESIDSVPSLVLASLFPEEMKLKKQVIYILGIG